MSNLVTLFETNKFIISIAAVITVIGSKHLAPYLIDECTSIFGKHYMKKIILFCLIFLYSKDVKSTLLLTVIIISLFPKIFYYNNCSNSLTKIVDSECNCNCHNKNNTSMFSK
jgi:hypothetical protein